MKTIQELDLDGYEAIKYVLERTYGSVSQAIAKLTLLSHPETVKQTDNKALFRVIRSFDQRGKHFEKEQLMYCDNTSPTLVFRWANWLPNSFGKRHFQFNHIYRLSKAANYYTSLANLCVTPSYIAKLTDSEGLGTAALLRYRSWEQYGFLPEGVATPVKPVDYDKLEWAPFLDPVPNVIKLIESQMLHSPKSTPARSAEKYGWLGTGSTKDMNRSVSVPPDVLSDMDS